MKFIICFASLLLAVTSFAQTQVQHTGWLANYNTFKINHKFSFHFDEQVRSSDQWANLQTVLIRPGINYHINKKTTVTLGYTNSYGRRNIGVASGYLSEQRIWQQLSYVAKIKNISINNRIRIEERWMPTATLENGKVMNSTYEMAYRLRCYVRGIIPLNKQPVFKSGWYAAVQEELFFNWGNKDAVNGKSFDQNRFYLALGNRILPKVDIELGSMNQYIVGKTDDINNHIVQLAVYKRL
jgi:hypothetical protein